MRVDGPFMFQSFFHDGAAASHYNDKWLIKCVLLHLVTKKIQLVLY